MAECKLGIAICCLIPKQKKRIPEYQHILA